MSKLKNGIDMDFQKASIEQLMYDSLFNVLIKSSTSKPSSFEKHELNYRLYIKNSSIGYLYASNATSKAIQLYYNELFEKGLTYIDKNNVSKTKKVSSEKIFDLNKTLRFFFTYCIFQSYRRENPCSLNKISIPGYADSSDEDDETIFDFNIQAFDDEEVKTKPKI